MSQKAEPGRSLGVIRTQPLDWLEEGLSASFSHCMTGVSVGSELPMTRGMQARAYDHMAEMEQACFSNQSYSSGQIGIHEASSVLASATHILKLERYREDEHGPCARATCKCVKRSIYFY